MSPTSSPGLVFRDSRTTRVLATLLLSGLFLAMLVGTASAVVVDKVGICHATNSDTKPYQFFSVDRNSTKFQGHEAHAQTPTKAWKKDTVWHGVTYLTGTAKPDLIEFQLDAVTPITEAYCLQSGDAGGDPVSGIALDKYVATGPSAPGAACGDAPWAATLNVTTGDPIHWCLRIENTGDDDLSSILVVDDLNVTPPTGAAGCALDATLAVDGVDECTYSTTAVAGTNTNYAAVSAVGDDNVSDTASAAYTATAGSTVAPAASSVTCAVGGVEVTLNNSASTVPITYEARNSLAGSALLFSVVVPAGQTATQTVTVGEDAPFDIALTAADGATTANTWRFNGTRDCQPTIVVISNPDPDPVPTVTLVPGISLDKSADEDTYLVGDTITYTYVITNTGETTLATVTLDDDVLGDLTGLLETTTLPPGESTTVTTTQLVSDDHVGSLTNVAVASGLPPEGARVSATDEVTVDVAAVLGVVIDKPEPAPEPAPSPDPAPVEPAPEVAAEELPRTGLDAGPMALIALAMLVLGGRLLRRPEWE